MSLSTPRVAIQKPRPGQDANRPRPLGHWTGQAADRRHPARPEDGPVTHGQGHTSTHTRDAETLTPGAPVVSRLEGGRVSGPLGPGGLTGRGHQLSGHRGLSLGGFTPAPPSGRAGAASPRGIGEGPGRLTLSHGLPGSWRQVSGWPGPSEPRRPVCEAALVVTATCARVAHAWQGASVQSPARRSCWAWRWGDQQRGRLTGVRGRGCASSGVTAWGHRARGRREGRDRGGQVAQAFPPKRADTERHSRRPRKAHGPTP